MSFFIFHFRALEDLPMYRYSIFLNHKTVLQSVTFFFSKNKVVIFFHFPYSNPTNMTLLYSSPGSHLKKNRGLSWRKRQNLGIKLCSTCDLQGPFARRSCDSKVRLEVLNLWLLGPNMQGVAFLSELSARGMEDWNELLELVCVLSRYVVFCSNFITCLVFRSSYDIHALFNLFHCY